MAPWLPFLGLAGTLSGCLCLYRASPNQRWGNAPWSATPARMAGVVLLMTSGWICLHTYALLTAVFVFCTSLMLCFCLVAYLGALVGLYRKDTHANR